MEKNTRTYIFNEGTLEMPAEWEDYTVHAFSSKVDGKEDLSFTISKETLPWGMSFSEFAKTQFIQIARQLHNFEETKNISTTIADRDAVVIDFHWEAPHGKIYQQMTIVNAEEKALIFTVTRLNDLTDTQKTHIQEMLSHLELTK